MENEERKAKFTVPTVLNAGGANEVPGRFALITLRANEQFNTTIYQNSDTLRGLDGNRMIVLMSPIEMRRAQLDKGDLVTLTTDYDDGMLREVSDLAVTPYDLPHGCLAGYYPEFNPLVSLKHHDQLSKTPAAKGVPMRIRRADSPQ